MDTAGRLQFAPLRCAESRARGHARSSGFPSPCGDVSFPQAETHQVLLSAPQQHLGASIKKDSRSPPQLYRLQMAGSTFPHLPNPSGALLRSLSYTP